MKKNLLLAVCLFISTLVSAGPGLKLIANSSSGSADKASPVTTIHIGASEMVIQTKQGGDFTMFFDATKDEITIVDHKKKQFSVLGKTELKEIQQQMGQMVSLLKAFSQNLTSDQKEKFSYLLNGKPEGVQYKAGRDAVTVGKWKTTEYKAVDGDQKVLFDTNIVPFKTLGVSKQEVASVSKLSTLLDTYLSGIEQMLPGGSIFSDLTSTDNPMFNKGVPVKTVSYNAKGGVQNELLVSSAEKVNFSLEDFKIPADYSKTKFGLPNPMQR